MVHLRHSHWSESGVWQRIFEALAADTDNEYVMIDTIVRAHQHSAGGLRKGPKNHQAIGHSRGG